MSFSSDVRFCSRRSMTAPRCDAAAPPLPGRQHSSSASRMGGMGLLADLYGLTWMMARVLTGLMGLVLRWVWLGSSVNRVFFLFVS